MVAGDRRKGKLELRSVCKLLAELSVTRRALTLSVLTIIEGEVEAESEFLATLLLLLKE